MSTYNFSFYSKFPSVKVIPRKWWEIWKHDEVIVKYEDSQFLVAGLTKTEADVLVQADGSVSQLILKVATAITKHPLTHIQLETEPGGKEYIPVSLVNADTVANLNHS